MKSYDEIVIGGGTGGFVIANRLSEEAGHAGLGRGRRIQPASRRPRSGRASIRRSTGLSRLRRRPSPRLSLSTASGRFSGRARDCRVGRPTAVRGCAPPAAAFAMAKQASRECRARRSRLVHGGCERGRCSDARAFRKAVARRVMARDAARFAAIHDRAWSTAAGCDPGGALPAVLDLSFRRARRRRPAKRGRSSRRG